MNAARGCLFRAKTYSTVLGERDRAFAGMALFACYDHIWSVSRRCLARVLKMKYMVGVLEVN